MKPSVVYQKSNSNLKNIPTKVIFIDNQYCVKTQRKLWNSFLFEITRFSFYFSNRITKVCVNDWPASKKLLKKFILAAWKEKYTLQNFNIFSFDGWNEEVYCISKVQTYLYFHSSIDTSERPNIFKFLINLVKHIV